MEAAFFDLDKTVIARSSTLAFGRPLYREGFINRGELVKGIYAQLVYLLTGADEDKMEKMRGALLELTRGWEKQKLETLVQETLSELIDPIIYAEAMDLVEQHVAAGRRVYLVSSSAEEIVFPIARYLGVPHAIATRPGIQDGKYTGELEFYCYGPGKREAILAEAAEHGIDLDRSYAYSDSVTDVPMLETVGHPHAVNPDKDLRAIATEREWPILEFANPISVRQRLRERGAVLAERGRVVAAEGARIARQMPRTVAREAPRIAREAPRYAREMPRYAREMPRRARESSPSPVTVAAIIGAVALLWLLLRRRHSTQV
jgi:HAD superfamily hydrolase (TIGR01490 family)